MSNSSGSVERFLLGLAETKVFEVLAPGGTQFVVDVANPIEQGIDGALAGQDVVVLVETADPAIAVKASLTTALAGANNDLAFLARSAGVAGNAITVEYVDPAANDAVLAVSVVGTAITVDLATDNAGVITSTAAQVLAALLASAPAMALISAALAPSNSGAGIVTALAATPLANGSDAAVTAFSTVATLTVKPGGKATATAAVGRYSRFRNTGAGTASVVAKPTHRIQPFASL